MKTVQGDDRGPREHGRQAKGRDHFSVQVNEVIPSRMPGSAQRSARDRKPALVGRLGEKHPVHAIAAQAGQALDVGLAAPAGMRKHVQDPRRCGRAHADDSSWYSSSILTSQIGDLSVLPARMASTARLAESIEWSWLL